MLKSEIINTIVSYLKENNVNEIGLFGSFARGEETMQSDIDLLVKYNRGTTLFDIARMKLELTEKIGREVDLVDKDAVSPLLMNYVLKDLQSVYHA